MAGGKQDLHTVSLCEEIRPDYESYQIYHIISYHIISYHIISYHIYHIISGNSVTLSN